MIVVAFFTAMADLAYEAKSGDAYCSTMDCALVPEPEKDAAWDGTEFFDLSDDEEDEGDQCEASGGSSSEFAYYSQRATDGGLIVSEGTSISGAGGEWFGAPGLYSEEQVAGWKRITNAVHRKRGLMFSQLWHTGRSTHVDSTKGAIPVSSSVNSEYWQDSTIQESTPHGWRQPRQPSPHRALDITEIPGIVEEYRKAAGARPSRRL
jgi:hypothetical protein